MKNKLSFSESLIKRQKDGFIPVITDFKCISPKDGELFKKEEAAELAKKMADAGAPAISVVTEQKDFGGSLQMLENICTSVNIPVLRKDFIKNKSDIDDTLEFGASAVLLIISCMSCEELEICYRYSLDCGIEPLVETHNIEELKIAASLGSRLIGINNKNIRGLEKDNGTVETTKNLAKFKPENSFLISESGILTPEDVKAAADFGADAVLIGTAVWKAENPFEYYKKLCVRK